MLLSVEASEKVVLRTCAFSGRFRCRAWRLLVSPERSGKGATVGRSARPSGGVPGFGSELDASGNALTDSALDAAEDPSLDWSGGDGVGLGLAATQRPRRVNA